ncbi:hypothetical protein ACFP81_07630 [Deinococcus lacus]|uniref:Uncharacterized protein n=1 Tax=Deinococcus lacus TaxID=392561 RepID=A0ABW1YC58_9DEIO
MKALRYIITRPCLQEGSMRLLKYLEGQFPESGPVKFYDEAGQEYPAEVRRDLERVLGLGAFYKAHHLNVNDVMMVTPLMAGCYKLEGIVKPYAKPAPEWEQTAPRAAQRPAPARSLLHPAPEAETRRVVVDATPHVREVRVERVEPAALSQPGPAFDRPDTRPEARLPAEGRALRPAPVTPAPAAPPTQAQSGDTPPTAVALRERLKRDLRSSAPEPEAPAAAVSTPGNPSEEIAEFGRLSGYRVEHLGAGLTRLKAELGPHSYTVLIADSVPSMGSPEWRDRSGMGSVYRVWLASEDQRPEGVAYVTREVFPVLSAQARLAPLSPLDLRSYWHAGILDLRAAQSVARVAETHVGQRGAFSLVLMALAQQPANSLVSSARIAEYVGPAHESDLTEMLETLTRPPFMLLRGVAQGEYLLRSDVGEFLADLAGYAGDLRRRIRPSAAQADDSFEGELEHLFAGLSQQ